MNNIILSRQAKSDLKKLDNSIIDRIIRKKESLKENPVALPLTGNLQGCYKLPVGQWRIIYTIDGDDVIILNIGHRKDIYRH
ncbi:MAG: type II toxin-antitoxin system RelE/ParE family toxin [Nitrospirae bacterium]|nr:type II toxin-antitoxin system RelE/ParE family toxin [Nitrospirota bacterium]MBF0536615.1 type II toxin-antitoxin system RelE/ParE family toxin [Nitrospirota bacterium]MBF0618122.1 type II toxin-antitoxin system RelE/ParE family toxin [Nitrospirota bacterium]